MVHPNTGRVKGIIDFADAAIGNPYQEFRLLFYIDPQLMEETAQQYAKLKRQKCDFQATHVYYLATEYSRLVEIVRDKKSKYTVEDIVKRLTMYHMKYKKIPKGKRSL